MDDVNTQYKSKPKEGEPWDVAIIGSGPAALTAAIYTTRGAASTLILAGESWGGQLMLTTTVDNYPGFPDGIQGPELMMRMRRQAERFGSSIVEVNVEQVDLQKKPFQLTSQGIVYTAKSIIIATGANTKWLGIPGEERLRGRGVSSCAPCDAPFFKGKKVAVVGGGDSAMEEALVLTKYTPEVTVIHRRDQLRASAAMQAQVLANKAIKILWNTEVIEILGSDKVEALRLKTDLNSEQGKKIKAGEIQNRNGKIVEEKSGFIIWDMPIEGLFVAIGHVPETDIFVGKLDMDEKGYIKKSISDKLPPLRQGYSGQALANEKKYSTTTNIPGVFVAGDVHDYSYRQAITAAGFGCMAAMDALRFLDKNAPTW